MKKYYFAFNREYAVISIGTGLVTLIIAISSLVFFQERLFQKPFLVVYLLIITCLILAIFLLFGYYGYKNRFCAINEKGITLYNYRNKPVLTIPYHHIKSFKSFEDLKDQRKFWRRITENNPPYGHYFSDQIIIEIKEDKEASYLYGTYPYCTINIKETHEFLKRVNRKTGLPYQIISKRKYNKMNIS